MYHKINPNADKTVVKETRIAVKFGLRELILTDKPYNLYEQTATISCKQKDSVWNVVVEVDCVDYGRGQLDQTVHLCKLVEQGKLFLVNLSLNRWVLAAKSENV